VNFLEHIGLSERGRLLRKYKEYTTEKKQQLKKKAVVLFIPAMFALIGLYIIRELLNAVAYLQKIYNERKHKSDEV